MWRGARKKLARNRRAVAGLMLLVGIIVLALLGPVAAPVDPTEQDLSRSLSPPMSRVGPGKSFHVFGTDQLGRDIASRVIVGSRISLLIGVGTVGISGLIGTTAGLFAGYFGGKFDAFIMRLVDLQLSFPVLLLAIVVAAVLGRGLWNLVAVLVVVSWVVYARLARGEVLSLREMEFVEAAHALGVPWHRVLRAHILPNISSSLVVIGTVEVARLIIAEATLSFLGLGVPPEVPAWGSMLADGRSYMNSAWWLATFPGLAIMVTVLSINLVGDGLRDLLDPRAGL